MYSLSPTVEGFRIAFRKPAISLAEIAWRWSIGAATLFLALMLLFEYADSLTVHPLDRLLLATSQPILIAQAIRRIFEGSAYRFTTAGTIAAIGLLFAWVVVASLGRAAVLKSILAEFTSTGESQRGTFVSLLGLNFLRAAVGLATLIAVVGSCFLASSAWASTRISAGDAVRLWFALVLLALGAWSLLNWLLSLAAVFVFDGAQSSFDAVASTLRLCTERLGALMVAGTWFALAHIGSFIFAFGAGFSILGVGAVLGAAPLLFLESVIALIYFGFMDWLYTARLAAYVAIVRGEDTVADIVTTPSADDRGGAVDTSELILSDVPMSAG